MFGKRGRQKAIQIEIAHVGGSDVLRGFRNGN